VIRQHNDKTHAEVLALIDELLTIGAYGRPTRAATLDGLNGSGSRLTAARA
jgi:hypothetical protein